MQESLIRSALTKESGATLLDNFKHDLLIEVLKKFNGNQSLSAINMGMNRGTFSKHMKLHGITKTYK